MSEISTIILTYNEEIHLERCIKNAKKFSKEIFIVDSFSNDKTIEIATKCGAKVYQNKWENNHAKQFNWGLENLPIKTEWVFRLDADEYLSEELIKEINNKIPLLSSSINGVVFQRKMIFQGKIITKGNIDWFILRLFRYKKAICENRWMDEHIILKEGDSITFENSFYDNNLNTIGWWVNKHNNYSIKEAIEMLNMKYHFFQQEKNSLTSEAQKKRNKKTQYSKMPLFIRCFVYFIYRYIIKLGFLDGREGFLWHFFQGLWYRTLVDTKILEIEKYANGDKKKMKEFIKSRYNIEI